MISRFLRLAARQPATYYWAGLLVSFLALYRAFMAADEATRGNWLSSDILFDAGVYRDLADGFPLAGAHFSIAPSLFPDLVGVSILMKLLGGPAIATFIYGLLQFTALVVLFIVLGRLARVATPDILNSVLLTIGTGLVFVTVAVLSSGLLPQVLFHLFQPAVHMGTQVMILAACGGALWMCFHPEFKRRWRVAAGMYFTTCLLATMSDLIFLPQFMVALMGTVLILWYAGLVSWRAGAMPVAIGWVGSVAGWAIGKHVVNRADLAQEVRLSRNRTGEALRTFLEGAIGQLSRYDWMHLAAACWLLFCCLFFLWSIRRYVVRREQFGGMSEGLRRTLFLYTFLGISGVCSVAVIVLLGSAGLTGPNKNYLWAMGYQYPLYFGSIFGIGYVAAMALGALRITEGRIRTCLAGVGLFVLVLSAAAAAGGASRSTMSLWSYQPTVVRFLDANAAKYGLKYGVAGYWQARQVLLFSRAGLRAYPVTPALDPYTWNGNSYWYRGHPRSRYPEPQYNFAVFDESDYQAGRASLVARFGEPAAEFAVEGNHLLVYNRAGDAGFRNLFASNPGLPRIAGRAASYTLGTAIDFRKGGNAALFEREGWEIAEAGGTWTLGSHSLLLMAIQPIPQTDLTLELEAHAFTAPRRPRFTESLIVNRVKLADWAIDEREPVISKTVSIPHTLLAAEPLRVELVNQDPRSPADVGYSADPRKLGLAVHRMVLAPADEAARPATRYIPGTTIDFRTGGNAGPFEEQGWDVAEAGGTWTLGERAGLRLDCDPPPKADLVLEVEMHAFAPPQRPQFTASVWVNHHRLVDWLIASPAAMRKRVRIPRAMVTSPLLQVEFVNHDPRSPAEVGFSGDRRKVGLAIHTIRVTEAATKE